MSSCKKNNYPHHFEVLNFSQFPNFPIINHLYKLLDSSEELMWMDFETRMRKVIKDFVTPVIERAQEDRKYINKLEKKRQKHEKRMVILETSVFKS